MSDMGSAAPAALTHCTVLLNEAVAALKLRPEGVYVDCTFGRGGHSRLILSQLGAAGRLIAFDKDPAAIAEADTLNDPRFTIVHHGFATFSAALDQLGVGQVDGVLMDLGISSPQIDEGARGFSFRFDAPLDMRMDTTRGETAAEWLARADEADLREVIKTYGEERFAKQIAAAIVATRAEVPLTTTGELSRLVAKHVHTREKGQDPATRTFQAIRIFINRELDEYLGGIQGEFDADTRFAIAVAAYGQQLRGGQYNGKMGWNDIIRLAQQANKPDPYGLRNEFVELAKIAQSLSAGSTNSGE